MDGGFPVLTAIIVVPLAGAVAVMCTPVQRPEIARAIGYATTAAVAGLAGGLLWSFDSANGGFQFVDHARWFTGFGTQYIVGVDGSSLWMVVVTAWLFPIGLLASAPLTHRVRAYTAWFLLLEAAIMGIFLSIDLILFFVFWELLLVPMYFLILGWGHDRNRYAATKFFLYTMAGSAFLLVALLALGFLHQADTGVLTWDFRVLAEWNGLATTTERWLFAGFMISFAVKAPLVPFHTWLPDVHTNAPTFGSVILAGVLLKMGAYGFLRFSFPLFPEASVWFAPLLLTLSVIGIVYGAVVATMQTDLKRLIAYSSVSHMGFVILGIFSLTTIGLDGALFIMVSHPLTTGALFLLVGMIDERRHTRELDELGGLWRSVPVLSSLFLVAVFASIGVPGLSGFVGEFLALLGAFLHDRPYAVVATVGVILSAVYLLWAYKRAFTGKPEGENASLRDVSIRELATVVPLLAFSLFLGLYPQPVLERVEPTMRRYVENFERKTDYREPEFSRRGGSVADPVTDAEEPPTPEGGSEESDDQGTVE